MSSENVLGSDWFERRFAILQIQDVRPDELRVKIEMCDHEFDLTFVNGMLKKISSGGEELVEKIGLAEEVFESSISILNKIKKGTWTTKK